MISAQIINGVELSNANGLESLEITPLDIAMGSVPGWNLLLDPDYVDADGSRARNMPRRGTYGTSFGSSENPNISVGTFANGARSFYAAATGGQGFGMMTPARPNPTQWSWFGVSKIETGIPQRLFANNSSVAGDGDIGIYIAISDTGNQITLFEKWNGSTGINVSRLQAVVSLQNDIDPALLEVTFSVSRGISIFKNGTLIAQNTEDKRPLNLGLNAGQNAALIGARGHHGLTGLLDIDLSHPLNAAHRRAIEQYAAWHYGIGDLKQIYTKRPDYFDLAM